MKYTDSHEWIRIEEDTGTMGISAYAQEELGEVVSVELPEVGKEVQAGEEIAILESTKAASDIYAPVSGTILEVNREVMENPSLLNSDPESKGWLIKIAIHDDSSHDHLLDSEQYLQLIR